MGQPTREKIPLLIHLDKITDICIGNLDDNEIGKLSLPELLSQLEVCSSSAFVEQTNYFINKLKLEFTLLEQDWCIKRAACWKNSPPKTKKV